MLGKTRGAQRDPPKRCPGASRPPAMPFIDLPAQSLRGDERVIAAIRPTRALATLMALERRAFLEPSNAILASPRWLCVKLARPSPALRDAEGAERGGDVGGAMTDVRPLFSIYERHIPIELARVAVFVNPIGGEILDNPRTAALTGVPGADHGKTVAGYEGGRCILQSREGPDHG